MKIENLKHFVILYIEFIKRSLQDDLYRQAVIKIPLNITIFDLSKVSLGNLNTKIIIQSDLLKNVTNSNHTENTVLKILDLSNNLIEFIDKFTFFNFQNLEDISLGQNCLKYYDIRFSKSLRYLRLSDNQISDINRDSFKNLENLFVLELHFNKIQLIKNDTYSSLSSMEYLFFFKNSIHTIDDYAFANMTKLKFLFLFSNKLNKIHKRMFRNLFCLTQLWLFENDMTEIESESFIDLIKLEKLHLYSNKLNYVDNLTFVGLDSLQELWLQKNNLKQVEPIFYNLSNLNSIVFDNNKLERVDPDCFKFNQNLIKIELFSNEISQINNLNIENLIRLEELNLNENFLKENFFLNNTHLTKLNLNFNRIEEFRKKMFLPNLLVLFVSSNRVQILPNEIFIYLTALEELDLSLNRIIKLEKMSFKGLVNLRTLNLAKNYLDDVNSDYFIEDLKMLENLDLSYNYFYFLDNDYFKHLKNLKNLRINNNKIKEISSSLFDENKELVSLYLNSNNLKRITLNLSKLEVLELNFNELNSNEFNLPSLKKLGLADNQISVLNLAKLPLLDYIDLSNNLFKFLNDTASLEMGNLKSFIMNGSYDFVLEQIINLKQLVELDLSFNNILTKNFSLKSLINLEKIRFRSMKNFKNFDLLLNPNLKEVDFSMNSLENNFSMFDSLKKLEIFVIQNVGLIEITQIRFENFENLLKLDLSYNSITYLNENTFKTMSKLNYLDLSFNKIMDLDVGIFRWLRYLVYLNIEQNHVSSIGDSFLNYLDIEVLQLANNNLKRLPQFEIKKETKRPIPLRIVDLRLNRLVQVEKFSNGINGIQSLKLDSNNISTIDHDALVYLTTLKTLSLSNNSLTVLTNNNFFGLFSLQHLNLSMNLISWIEQKTFQNLNKLLILDLSQNLLMSLDANVFYGLKSLKTLNLRNISFKLNNDSFNYLSNISNIFLDDRIVEENECLLIESLKRMIIKESFFYRDEIRQVKRYYFRSLNFLSFLSLTNKSCDMKLFYLQFNIHLNLMTDNDLENFYSDCSKFIIKNENQYNLNRLKCKEPISNEANIPLNFWLYESWIVVFINLIFNH